MENVPQNPAQSLLQSLDRTDMINTHTHDGLWSVALNRLLMHPLSFRAERMKKELIQGCKPEEMTELREQIKNISPIAERYLEMILNGSGNWDSANNVDALYLLCLASLSSNKERDFYIALAEQLEDMATGSCPQGRTTRIAQVLDSFL